MYYYQIPCVLQYTRIYTRINGIIPLMIDICLFRLSEIKLNDIDNVTKSRLELHVNPYKQKPMTEDGSNYVIYLSVILSFH